MALGIADIIESIRQKEIVVQPLSRDHIQRAGVQLSLGGKLAKLKPGQRIDPASGVPPEWEVITIDPVNGYEVKPGEFILGHTQELLGIPNDILAMVDGRSTAARLGIVPHMAAMAIWPGHGKGERGPRPITLEFKNQGDATIVFRPGWWIANLTFHRLETPVKISYDDAKVSRYGNDTAIMLPRFNGEILQPENFIEDVTTFDFSMVAA